MEQLFRFQAYLTFLILKTNFGRDKFLNFTKLGLSTMAKAVLFN